MPNNAIQDGKPYLTLGAPGGTTITMGVLQTILNVVDFDMSAQEAVSRRVSVRPGHGQLTNRILRSVERELVRRGYPTRRYPVSYMVPLVHAIRLRNGALDGGADPAGDGMAATVQVAPTGGH